MNIRERLDTSDPRDIAEYVDRRLAALETKLTKHIDAQFDDLRNDLRAAFPDGDMAKHRLGHERQAEQEADYRSLRRSLIEKGSFGLLGTVAFLNWEALKLWLKEVFK